MHAYLIVGNDTSMSEKELIEKLNGKFFEFPLSKIEDVRQLNDFLKHTLSEKTLIICRDIDESSNEALNSFLKSLEEPQANVNFILTAKNEYKVLPTIVSRCQVIRDSNSGIKVNDDARNFINSSEGQRFLMVDKIKGRPESIEFVQGIITELDRLLKSDDVSHIIALQLETTQNKLDALKANGNVNLHLSSLVVNLGSWRYQP